MNFSIFRRGEYCILHIEGNSCSEKEREELNKKLTFLAEKETNLVVNVEKLKYGNSQILGQFLLTYKKMKKKNGYFALTGPTVSVRDLLRITSIDRVFPVFENEKAFNNAVNT